VWVCVQNQTLKRNRDVLGSNSDLGVLRGKVCEFEEDWELRSWWFYMLVPKYLGGRSLEMNVG
jgi:hypothetical protein